MTESEVEGASLPTDGIDVDETSAYFGVTQTSDLIIRLNETDRLNGLGEFLTLTSDLLLTDQFDFDVVSERLGCESGEIYYLLSGPFGIFTMTDPLRLYLGQQDSGGNQGTAEASIPNDDDDSSCCLTGDLETSLFCVGLELSPFGSKLPTCQLCISDVPEDPERNSEGTTTGIVNDDVGGGGSPGPATVTKPPPFPPFPFDSRILLYSSAPGASHLRHKWSKLPQLSQARIPCLPLGFLPVLVPTPLPFPFITNV